MGAGLGPGPHRLVMWMLVGALAAGLSIAGVLIKNQVADRRAWVSIRSDEPARAFLQETGESLRLERGTRDLGRALITSLKLKPGQARITLVRGRDGAVCEFNLALRPGRAAGQRPRPSCYDYLLDMYAAHVNPCFWSIHGWIDGLVETWSRDFGRPVDWTGAWLGPMEHMHPAGPPGPGEHGHGPPRATGNDGEAGPAAESRLAEAAAFLARAVPSASFAVRISDGPGAGRGSHAARGRGPA